MILGRFYVPVYGSKQVRRGSPALDHSLLLKGAQFVAGSEIRSLQRQVTSWI